MKKVVDKVIVYICFCFLMLFYLNIIGVIFL